mgnify:CR=1
CLVQIITLRLSVSRRSSAIIESKRAQKITVPRPIIMTIIKTHRLTLKHLDHGDMGRLVELIGLAEVALNLSG